MAEANAARARHGDRLAGAGGHRAEAALPALLVALTAATGMVDAVSYLGLGHVFTANMTGNVVLLGLLFGYERHFIEITGCANRDMLVVFLVSNIILRRKR